MKRLFITICFLFIASNCFAEKVEIELSQIQYDALTQYAHKNLLEPEVYAGNIVRGWLDSHIKGYYTDLLKKNTPEQLETKLGKVKIK